LSLKTKHAENLKTAVVWIGTLGHAFWFVLF